MMEHWPRLNKKRFHGVKIMGFGELMEWFIGKIKLTKHERNEKFRSNPFGRRRIYIIPLFHYSIIPCVRQDCQASVNIYDFTKL